MSVDSGNTMYAFERALPPELLSEVEPGTNLLVSGPAMSGKRQLMLRLLASDSPEEGAIVVTARDPAKQIITEFEKMSSNTDYFRVIDCVGSRSGGSSAQNAVRTVSSPGDLTGIGIEFSELAREAEAAEVDRLRIGFDSLSPLLMYVDVQRLFRFLHVFTSQIQSQGWLGLFAIDPDSHDEQVVNTVSQLFDGLIEVRVANGTREARVRGVTESPTDWVPLDQ